MKYIKTHESKDLRYIYLVIDFSKFIEDHNMNEKTTKYIFRTTMDNFTKDKLIFLSYYFYQDDNIKSELQTTDQVNKYEGDEMTQFSVLYQTNSFQDAVESLKMFIKSKNYNL